MKQVELICPQCGAPIKFIPNQEKQVCEYCGYVQLIEVEDTPEEIRQKSHARSYGYHSGRLQAESEARTKAYQKSRKKGKGGCITVVIIVCVLLFVVFPVLAYLLGRTTMTKIDPFEYIKVSFTGTDGEGKIVIEPVDTEDDVIVSYIDYEASQQRDLSQGDKVIVTADSMEYLLTEEQKTYTVDGLDEYLKNLDDISQDAMELIHSKAKTDLTNYNLDRSMDAGYYIDMKPVKMYLLTDGKQTNHLYDVFAVELDTNKGAQTYYGVVRYYDVVIHEGEQTTLDMSGGSYWGNLLYVKGMVYFSGFTSLEEVKTDILTNQEKGMKLTELDL